MRNLVLLTIKKNGDENMNWFSNDYEFLNNVLTMLFKHLK